MTFRLLKLPLRACALISLAILPACGTMTGFGATDSGAPFCAVMGDGFRWSVSDSDATIARAKELNAAGKALSCSWAVPK